MKTTTPQTLYRVALCHREGRRLFWVQRAPDGTPQWTIAPPRPLPMGKAEILRRDEALLSRCHLLKTGAFLALVEADA